MEIGIEVREKQESGEAGRSSFLAFSIANHKSPKEKDGRKPSFQNGKYSHNDATIISFYVDSDDGAFFSCDG